MATMQMSQQNQGTATMMGRSARVSADAINIKELVYDKEGRPFTANGELVSKTALQNPVKKHRCDICGKAFRLKQYLKEHLLIHTGAKPYECKICGMRFRQHGRLSLHRKSHGNDRNTAGVISNGNLSATGTSMNVATSTVGSGINMGNPVMTQQSHMINRGVPNFAHINPAASGYIQMAANVTAASLEEVKFVNTCLLTAPNAALFQGRVLPMPRVMADMIQTAPQGVRVAGSQF